MSSRLERLGRHCVEHPVGVLVRAMSITAVLVLSALAWGGSLTDQLRVGGSGSDAANEFALASYPERLGAIARVVWVSEDGRRIDTPERHDAIRAALEPVWDLPGVGFVDPPFQPGLLSADGTTLLSEVAYDPRKVDETTVERLRSTLSTVPGVRVEIGGTVPEIAGDPEAGSEVLGVLAALVILLVVFGSLVAAGIPIVLAGWGLGAGFAGILLLAAIADVSTLAPQLAAMIGLGVGIDYALVVMTRYRQLVADGVPRDDAIVGSIASAGRAVIVAGATVVVSILGLVVTGISVLFTMGVATAMCVAATVVINVTVLPAVLALLGPRVDAVRIGPRRRPAAGPTTHSRWTRWAEVAMRRPVLATLGTTAALGVLAAPLLVMEIGYNDASTAPVTATERRAYDLITEHFGEGFNGTLEALVDLVPGDPGRRDATMTALAEGIAATPGVATVLTPEFGHGGEQAAVRFFLTTGPQDEAGRAVVATIRSNVLPSITGPTGTRGWVGGGTALRMDFSERVADRLPWFVVAVVGVSVLLLTLAFRSPVVALKAALMNLLSIGASYGVLVAVFQWGWGSSLLGMEDRVPIDAYVPVFLFAILFGLSMDYEVFLLARIREAYLSSGDNDASILTGIEATAGVITSAAAVMVGVFAGFLLGGDPVVKMFGVGLTTAIVIDVTVVRLFLLPAVMKLLGSANWWAPGALRPRRTVAAHAPG